MSEPCPKCGYLRQAVDSAPAWQCPACGIAVDKYLATHQPGPQTQSAAATLVGPAPTLPLPEISLASRIGAALPDVAGAWLFAWCWKNPLGWHPDLSMALGQVVLIEFLVLHSSVFFAALISSGADRWTKVRTALLLCLIYVPFAAAFALANRSWWPVAAFAWLLSGRMAMVASGRASDLEKKRLRALWGDSFGFYILFAFLAAFATVPSFGYLTMSVPWSGWAIRPQQVMCWGFLYFSAVAVRKLLDNYRWGSSLPDQEAPSS